MVGNSGQVVTDLELPSVRAPCHGFQDGWISFAAARLPDLVALSGIEGCWIIDVSYHIMFSQRKCLFRCIGAEREFLIPCVPCCAKPPGMTVCSTGSKEGGKCSPASAEAHPVALSRQRTWIPYRDPQLEYRHALEW